MYTIEEINPTNTIKRMKQDLIDMKKELVEFRKCHSKAVLILSVNDDLSDREAVIFELLNKSFIEDPIEVDKA